MISFLAIFTLDEKSDEKVESKDSKDFKETVNEEPAPKEEKSSKKSSQE